MALRKASSRYLAMAVAVLAPVAAAQQLAPSSQTSPQGRTPRHVVVSIPDRKLAVLENGQILRTFNVAVGSSITPSPDGEFHIVRRLENPTYYHPGVVIPPGKDNPLGPRWVGLDQKGFGIHGTNQPWSIGKAASHGCIRMQNRDIVQFFDLVRAGDTVEIRGERTELIAQIFGGVGAPAILAQAQPAAVVVAGGTH